MMRSASNWAWSHCSCSFHKLNAATSDRLFAFRVLSWASHMKSSTHCPLICRAEMDTTHGHHNWTCGCDNWNLLQIVYGIDKLHDQSSKKALNATWVGRPKTHQGMANNGTTLDHNDELYYYDLLWYWCIPRCMYVYIYNILYIYTIPSDFGETLDLDIEDNLLSSSIFLPSLQHKGDTIPWEILPSAHYRSKVLVQSPEPSRWWLLGLNFVPPKKSPKRITIWKPIPAWKCDGFLGEHITISYISSQPITLKMSNST